MSTFKGQIIIIPRNDSEKSAFEIGEAMHKSLVGKPDYKDSNVGIHIEKTNDGSDFIELWVDDCEEPILDAEKLCNLFK